MKKHRKGQQAHRTSGNSRRLRGKASRPWGWLMSGMLIGIFGLTAIFLFLIGKWPFNLFKTGFNPSAFIEENEMPLKKDISPKNSAKLLSTKTRSANTKTPQKEGTRFEFYQLLPGMEVPLPETRTETASPTSKPILAKTETKLAAAQYLVQAGKFRTQINAKTLKERLALQGLLAQIQKIEATDGAWFRVTLGPFPSETLALSQKNRLAKEKIAGILLLQRQ